MGAVAQMPLLKCTKSQFTSRHLWRPWERSTKYDDVRNIVELEIGQSQTVDLLLQIAGNVAI